MMNGGELFGQVGKSPAVFGGETDTIAHREIELVRENQTAPPVDIGCVKSSGVSQMP
jgi:hypothetical protein